MLSTYLTEPVDFLKMDIEGAEDQVLKDLNETGKLALVREIVLNTIITSLRVRTSLVSF